MARLKPRLGVVCWSRRSGSFASRCRAAKPPWVAQRW